MKDNINGLKNKTKILKPIILSVPNSLVCNSP